MNDKKTTNQFPTPDDQLESAIGALLAPALDQDAISRVKIRAKGLAVQSKLPELENPQSLNFDSHPAGFVSSESSLSATIAIDETATGSVAKNRRMPKVGARRYKRRFWMNVIAASLLFLVLGATMLLSGNKTAFAKAIERLQTVGTLSFVMSFESNYVVAGLDGDNVAPMVNQVFVAADGRYRLQNEAIVVILNATGRKRLILDKETKQACQEDSEDDFNYLTWFETLKSGRNKPTKRLGKKSLLGIEVEGFVVNDSNDQIAIWVDSKSNKLVQVELEVLEDGISVKGTISELKYDESLEESLFSMEVPRGYSVVSEMPVADFPAAEEFFIEALHEIIEDANGNFPQDLPESVFGIQALLMDLEKGDYKYLGAGKTRNDKRTMVFWYRTQDETFRGIYSDLSAAEVAESDILTKQN